VNDILGVMKHDRLERAAFGEFRHYVANAPSRGRGR
jgi:hypothetical protein